MGRDPRDTRALAPRSVSTLQPDTNLARLVRRLDVDDAWAATDGAVFGVRLPFAPAGVDGDILLLAAKGACNLLERALPALHGTLEPT